MQFRQDINGLRAIALIGVLLFHFDKTWMPGGFAGVDVFFVISGYLMTGIIFRGIGKGNFDLLAFYAARANRIIPALAVLCLVLLVFGWFYLIPLDYKVLGKHVGSSVGFLSNMVYWRESGYFAADSYEKWLLHTWSLSVEWQFYLIYPLVIVILSKFLAIKHIRTVVLFGTLFSCVFSVVASHRWPDLSYYLLPTRMWEMLIGGVAYLYPLKLSDNKKKIFELVGLFFIMFSYFFFSEENIWPGYLAIVPVLATFLIVQANRSDSALTGNAVFQSLGRWSYSIYLWHWPIVVFIYYFSMPNTYVYLGIILSFFLGYLSSRYIESFRFRVDFDKPIEYLSCKPIYMALLMMILGVSVFRYIPNSYLYPMPQTVLESFERKQYECFDKDYQHADDSGFCSLSDGSKRIFAFGDSHSYSALPVVESIADENNLHMTYTGYSGCVPLLGVFAKSKQYDQRNCKLLNDKAFEYIKTNDIDVVFLAARWTYYTLGSYDQEQIQLISNVSDSDYSQEGSIQSFRLAVQDTFSRYNDLGVKVVVLLQVPMQIHNADKIYYRALFDGELNQPALASASVKKDKHIDFQRSTNEVILTEAMKYNNIYVLDPTDIFCDNDFCLVGNETVSYYSDDDHLSIYGSYKIKDALSEMMLN